MSRKPFIAGNWKMNKKSRRSKKHSLKQLRQNFLHQILLKQVSLLQLLIWQLFLLLQKVQTLKLLLKTATLKMQVLSLVKLAPSFERNRYWLRCYRSLRTPWLLHETDEDINKKKAKAIFANGMLPIICCGESLETYEAGKAAEFVGAQGICCIGWIDCWTSCCLSYRLWTTWAIGTGKSASQDDAQKMCKVVRDVSSWDFGQEVADKARVQYGGSVKPENVASYMACPDVDGALVVRHLNQKASWLDFVK